MVGWLIIFPRLVMPVTAADMVARTQNVKLTVLREFWELSEQFFFVCEKELEVCKTVSTDTQIATSWQHSSPLAHCARP